jgi:hypothetical protein
MVDQRTRPDTSEIERFQDNHKSATWVFYLAAATVIGSYFAAESTGDWLCAATVEIAAFYSVYLWATRKVRGIPIMPAYAIMSLAYYGLPFASGHPVTQEFDFAEKWFAAATVAAVLLIMTMIWARLAKPTPRRVCVVKVLPMERDAVPILIACLAAAIAFQSNFISYVVPLPSEIHGIVRAILLSLGLLSMFCLAFLHGAGALRAAPKYLFFVLAVVMISYHAASLYLITATKFALAVAFGYLIGSGRVPWKLIVTILALLTVFQAGKEDLRLKYYSEGYSVTSPFGLLGEWFNTGLENLLGLRPAGDRPAVSLIQRASLVQMLLKTQTEAPATVPYLYGSTYIYIPALIVPRIIWPERPNTSEMLVQLNEEYGLLTRETAESTSIGWGLIAEANANFGFFGCIGIAILLGVLVGLTQRLCGRFSFLSARGMAALLVLIGLLTMEASMAQFVTTLAQSLVSVVVLALTVMQPRRVMV